jgi:hypothetical protein
MPSKRCPKHWKPYPCGKCRIESAQKPAQTPPARVELSEEQKNQIKDSLATKPEIRGSGTDHLINHEQESSLSSNTHSLAHPIVPSVNPVAPYGFDENGAPIKLPRTDQEIAAELREKEFLAPGDCHHKSNPRYCLHCGTANYKPVPVAAEPVDAEARIRQMFFKRPTHEQLRAQTRERQRQHARRDEHFEYWPEILQITRGQLIGMLDLTVYVTRDVQIKQLKPRSGIEDAIARVLLIPKQIEKRNQLIQKSEQCIRSFSAHIMKIQVSRGERNPEDILDSKTREKFKREERARILRCKQKIAELRKRFAGLEDLQARAGAWGSNEQDYEMAPSTEIVSKRSNSGIKTTEDILRYRHTPQRVSQLTRSF